MAVDVTEAVCSEDEVEVYEIKDFFKYKEIILEI